MHHPAEQRRHQLRMQPPIGRADSARQVGHALVHFRRRHRRAFRLAKGFVVKRLADIVAHFFEKELPHFKAPGRRQRLQAARAHGAWDDRAGDQFNRVGIDEPVVIGLPHAGDRQGRILHAEHDDFVQRLDVCKGVEQRAAAIGLAGGFAPPEGNPGVRSIALELALKDNVLRLLDEDREVVRFGVALFPIPQA